jgi:excinuclease ABC subunit C
LFLIQRVRDEAHRFAITSHRNQRSRKGLASRLDSIPGVGPSKRKALLGRFGSIQNILSASVEDLVSVPGISEQLAVAIKSHLE